MKVRLAIRGFAEGKRQFEDLVDLESEALEALLPALAEKHAAALASHELSMIEIEFLDEPNENERYFRFGTDTSHMVAPVGVDLEALFSAGKRGATS